MDLRNRRIRVDLCQRSGMQDANIEAKVSAQILRQSLQNSVVAAVAIDDRQIARRQRASNLAPKVAHEGRHSLDRQRHGAGRPFMLARKTCRHRWKLPKIESFAPSVNDEASKTLSQYDIGVERQVGAMLLDRADRQTKYRPLAEKL